MGMEGLTVASAHLQILTFSNLIFEGLWPWLGKIWDSRKRCGQWNLARPSKGLLGRGWGGYGEVGTAHMGSHPDAHSFHEAVSWSSYIQFN